jgi:hypothetical protein
MKLYEFIQAYPSRAEFIRICLVYTNMSRLIFEHIIVFTNNSFIIQTETESSLTDSNRVHLTPLRLSILIASLQ